jgi:hypothetical protein
VAKSSVYPHDLPSDFLDPLLDTYQCEGANSPEETQGVKRVSRPPLPYLRQKPAMHILS